MLFRSGGAKWRERYQDEELEHARYRDEAESRIRTLERELRDLRGQAPAPAPVAEEAPGSAWRGWFGWGRDNFIGSGPQANGWLAHWADFFLQRRLAPQLQRAADSGHRLPGADALLKQLPAWLEGHHPDPCLVHGDLWSGNAALLQGGGGALFDPAVYRGDREVDLAMAQLFGGFPSSFFAGYNATWPLPPGHRQRVELYNLYHRLNHANLFGGGYEQQAQQSIAALLGSLA